MSVTPPVFHAEMWPYVTSAAAASANHDATAVLMLLSSAIRGETVGADVVGSGVGKGLGTGVGAADKLGAGVGAGTHAPASAPPQPRRISPAAHTSSSRSEHDSHPVHVSHSESQLFE